ncbi:MAG: hypothetical protein GEV07_19960 [Streptosporangiales bacterium]|nr:hypothetical protein [Streptosporangiales bacterium]
MPLLVTAPGWISAAAPAAAARPVLTPLVAYGYWPTVVVLCTGLLVALYHRAVPTRGRWHRDLPGAIAAMLAWLAGSYLLRTFLTFAVTHSPDLRRPVRTRRDPAVPLPDRPGRAPRRRTQRPTRPTPPQPRHRPRQSRPDPPRTRPAMTTCQAPNIRPGLPARSGDVGFAATARRGSGVRCRNTHPGVTHIPRARRRTENPTRGPGPGKHRYRPGGGWRTIAAVPPVDSRVALTDTGCSGPRPIDGEGREAQR